ncbi:MAG: hypothetical protein ABI811_13050 [Acidobacteriota bacterium]
MRPRFQADADFNQKIVAGLRRREPSLDFLDARSGDITGLSDPEVLAAASATSRVLVSHDRRTMPVHFARFTKDRVSPGLLIVSQSLEIGTAIDDLLLLWAITEANEWINRIGYLPF